VLGSLLAVPAVDSGALAVFDFTIGGPPVVTLRGLPRNSGAAGIAIGADSVAWVVNSLHNTVTRINLKNGDTASFATGMFPQVVAISGGFVYVVNGNMVGGNPAGASWITVLSQGSGAPATTDSIPLTGLDARFATLGPDGFLYVVEAGTPGRADGKLSIVDPRSAAEQVVVNGLGESPGPAVYHPTGRLLIASTAEGILEVNTSTRVLLRGAGNGIKPTGSAIAALALDERGRVYALDQGTCTQPGAMYVLSPPPDYEVLQQVAIGVCPVAAVTMLVP
jgi:streptogramin lyase